MTCSGMKQSSIGSRLVHWVIRFYYFSIMEKEPKLMESKVI